MVGHWDENQSAQKPEQTVHQQRMVAAGLGYSIIPRMAVEAPRDREGLHVSSLAPLLHRQLAVVMRQDKILSKGIAELVKLLQRAPSCPRD
ncbi:LysR family transcriptional regulator substrate-binding protein [Kluyvera georgiana]|uniref:LysR family transcriptional regulator substrate-binding protein n=1 Tax=Kluyvera georgiana TaxID=73098 RepID=UPI0032209D55